MNKVMNVVRMVVALAMLGGIVWGMWLFKWWVLGGAAVYTLGLMSINKLYRMRTGKDMAMYVRVFKN